MDESRRKFLERFTATTGCFALSANLPMRLAYAQEAGSSGGRYGFPQGIASADPQPDAVLLWTRVVDSEGPGPVELTVQLAEDEAFDSLLVNDDVLAEADVDNTVRCFIDGLEPNRWFYYRFRAPDGSTSRTGRTRTAPGPEEEVPLNIAVFSCQNYESGYFNAYRHMIVADERAPRDRKIDLCMHMGDYIYENVNAGAVGPFDDTGGFLPEYDGSIRNASGLPSGGRPRGRGEQILPNTLDDYRHIYRSYLKDRALQDARAWYPFVHIWDDHEVLNDYWQAYHPSGSIHSLKMAGNQAWFEYLPAVMSDAPAGPAGRNDASDFESVEVENTPPGSFDEDYLSEEPNTLAAIGSMSIYRNLAWGNTADLLLLDGRSYRGPRGLDSAILGTALIGYPPAPVDESLIELMNAGRTANDGNPPATLRYEGEEIPNPRFDSPRASMLGARQKQWLKDSLIRSKARWKLLGNNVPMMRFGWDTRFREHGTRSGIYWTDSWDGYPVERRELMEFLLAEGLANVVSLTGDRHAHFAGTVYSDHDSGSGRPVIPELVGAGISAQDRLTIQQSLFRRDPELLRRTVFESSEGERLPSANAWLLFGAESARVLAEGGNEESVMEAAVADVNPHMVYSDIDAYGYYVARVGVEKITAEFIVTPPPIEDQTASEPDVRRVVRMEIEPWQGGEEPRITNVEADGEPPLLGLRPA